MLISLSPAPHGNSFTELIPEPTFSIPVGPSPLPQTIHNVCSANGTEPVKLGLSGKLLGLQLQEL